MRHPLRKLTQRELYRVKLIISAAHEGVCIGIKAEPLSGLSGVGSAPTQRPNNSCLLKRLGYRSEQVGCERSRPAIGRRVQCDHRGG